MAKQQRASQRGAASPRADSNKSIYEPTTAVTKPSKRPLKVYAFDPSAGYLMGNFMSISLNYEKLAPGPVGKKLAVVDFDGANGTYYAPVNLDDPRILINSGIDPTESDPQFHQQMVYAVAAETLQRFEAALGRRIHWRSSEHHHGEHGGKAHDGKPHDGKSQDSKSQDGIPVLLLMPHAMYQANAFYSPKARGILFGYFRASLTQPGKSFPGQTIFTCLSHDIIAHETTHAVIDGIRKYFTEPTNVDVAAFHEAFADVSALFRHFSHKEILIDTLRKTGGYLYRDYVRPEANVAGSGDSPNGAQPQPAIQADIEQPNPLIQLAQQFGQATGLRAGLRSALGTPPNSDDIKTKTEPHDRGSILVAAIFDAYFTIYLRRTDNIFRIVRSGGGYGLKHMQDLPAPLAERLAAEASRTASDFFTICARSLDYCPPVDITYGDFLRALITAHYDIDPVDPEGIRDAFMQAFRLRGIVATSAKFFSDDALRWDRVKRNALPPISNLVFGDPNGLSHDEKNANGEILREYIRGNAKLLGFWMDQKGQDIEVPSFHPTFRVGPDGGLRVDMVIEAVQTRMAKLDEDNDALGEFPVRGGVILIVSQQPLDEDGQRPAPQIRYVIHNHINESREKRQRMHYFTSGLVKHFHGDDEAHPGAGKHDAHEHDQDRFQINFGLIHGGL